MNKTLVKKWVKTLRSGKYVQGDGALRSRNSASVKGPDQFCCLGVLCDLVEPEKWAKRASGPYSALTFGKIQSRKDSTFDNRGFPSREFLAKVGLEPDVAMKLGNLNDDGASFEYIAHYIEQELLA